MPSFDHRIINWMRIHQTTVSSSKLEAAGISRGQRKRLIAAGVIERVVDGAYRFAGAELDELTRCAALCASRPQLIIAGPTAGRIWDIRRTPSDGLVHVIAPPHSQPCREPWVKAYRTKLLFADEIVYRSDGIRLTSPPRTVIDLARYLPDNALASAIESVLSTEMCTYETLARLARRLDTPGRPWVRRFLRILGERGPGRPRESDWERRVFDALCARGVADIESQVEQHVPGYGSARFDLAISSLRWVLKVDVHPEHRTLEGQANDDRRDRLSRGIGWDIERVGEAELLDDFHEVIDSILGAIHRRRAEVATLTAAGLWPPR